MAVRTHGLLTALDQIALPGYMNMYVVRCTAVRTSTAPQVLGARQVRPQER
jgi:hypothetical protein